MSHDVKIRAPWVRVDVDGGRVDVEVRQADLGSLAGEAMAPPIVARVRRELQGGGFGDPDAHPYAWGVFLQVDDRLARLTSARGAPREWTSLDRLEAWLREQGFRHWWVVNEIEDAG